MKWVNTDGRIPIESWCVDVDDGAMEQLINLSNHPVMFHHVAAIHG